MFADKVATVKDKGDQIANLKQCWREADAIVTRGLKRRADYAPEESLDEPLRQEVQDKLELAFRRTCSFQLPAAWQGFPSMLGRFHTEFCKRCHVRYIITKVRSLEAATSLGPVKKTVRMGDIQWSLFEHEASAEVEISSIFQYLYALIFFIPFEDRTCS